MARILQIVTLATLVHGIMPVPVAPPVVVVVGAGDEVVLRLQGYSGSGKPVLTQLVTAPASAASTASGAVFELSQLFLTQNRDPKKGRQIERFPFTLPSAAGNRVLYMAGSLAQQATTTFEYRVIEGALASSIGTVTLVPPSKRLVSSDFRIDTDGWQVSGRATLSRESLARGLLSQYIVATSGSTQQAATSRNDGYWRFVAPQHFLGNKVAAYGGTLTFVAGAFAGDFSPGQVQTGPLVTLECDHCLDGKPARFGHWPVAGSMDGRTKRFTVPIQPSAWRKDPRNTLVAWSSVTECELVRVLQSLSSLQILGDWSSGLETIGIDDVALNVAIPFSIPKACYS